MSPTAVQIVGAVLFAVAIVHTFSTKLFARLSHRYPAHAGLLHLLAEVEVVFGFWALVLVLFMMAVEGRPAALQYLNARNYTEPMFVFAIMVIAGSRPVLQAALLAVRALAALLPVARPLASYFLVLGLVPLLGSLITEPAAMTLAALMLRQGALQAGLPRRLKYATLGVLFVNVSIGGTLTPFAAPPVLMVAGKWGWDTAFMMSTFGWKAALAVTFNALVATALFARGLRGIVLEESAPAEGARMPVGVIAVSLAFLLAVVAFAHDTPAFMGVFLFFLGFAAAYPQYHDRLILREGLLVAFFLAGLVVLGGQQAWWLQPLLAGMSVEAVFWGATALTAVTDNAALTYLGSLVEGLSDAFKYALVAGAVTGGGLTVIANAPNPAGMAILRDRFDDGVVNPFMLLLAALGPTLVAAAAFRLL